MTVAYVSLKGESRPYRPSPLQAFFFLTAAGLLLFAIVRFSPMAMATFGSVSSGEDWESTLTPDTRMRLQLARRCRDREGEIHYLFRNDTIMRVNLEREAHELPIIDLHQAFGYVLPGPRQVSHDTCSEHATSVVPVTSNEWSVPDSSSEDGEALPKLYLELATRNSLALGAVSRLNIINSALGRPLLEEQMLKEMFAKGDEYVADYWASSLHHGDFWEEDQAVNEPNFILGGQENGFGYTISKFHKLHCIANLRMILAFYQLAPERVTRDINVHAIHCLDYLRWREMHAPDMYEEPIDTVDYMGMGIH